MFASFFYISLKRYPENSNSNKEAAVSKKHTVFALITTFLFLSGYFPETDAQDTESFSDSISIQCEPSVEFLFKSESQPICLNNFKPQGDSCTDLGISFKNLGVKISFFCDKNHLWEYNGLRYLNKNSQNIPVSVSLISDESEKLASVVIVFGKSSDTSNLFLTHYRDRDMPYIPDSIKPLEYDLEISRYVCQEKPIIVVDREYTFPVGYMRKEPILNYPEISAFHHGRSVKMPSGGSVAVAAFTKNYWHLNELPKISYDDPELIRKREILYNKWAKRHPPKEKKKKSKPPLIRFKPL
jgi:hypothetical protein